MRRARRRPAERILTVFQYDWMPREMILADSNKTVTEIKDKRMRSSRRRRRRLAKEDPNRFQSYLKKKWKGGGRLQRAFRHEVNQ